MSPKKKVLRFLIIIVVVLGLVYAGLQKAAKDIYSGEVRFQYEESFLPEYLREFHKKVGRWPDAPAALSLLNLDKNKIEMSGMAEEFIRFHRENVERIVIHKAQKDRLYYTVHYKNGEHDTWHADLSKP